MLSMLSSVYSDNSQQSLAEQACTCSTKISGLVMTALPVHHDFRHSRLLYSCLCVYNVESTVVSVEEGGVVTHVISLQFAMSVGGLMPASILQHWDFFTAAAVILLHVSHRQRPCFSRSLRAYRSCDIICQHCNMAEGYDLPAD